MSSPTSPYAGTSPVAALGGASGSVTLVEGQTFCLSGRTGDMDPQLPHGVFMFDTRVLSRWQLRLNGHLVEALAVDVDEPFAATFLGHGAPAPGHADADVVVFRHRHVGRGMRERIVVVNHGLRPTDVVVELRCDVDFADLFEVKEGRTRDHHRHCEVGAPEGPGGTHRLRFVDEHDDVGIDEARLDASDPATIEPGRLSWRLHLSPGAEWSTCLQLSATIAHQPIEPRFSCHGADAVAVPTVRLEEWRARLPDLRTDHTPLLDAYARSREDLGALRIFDPDHPDLAIVAAGAPWFMTVFGRDSLLTAWMSLLGDSSLAHGVLETLARFQGVDVDERTEEEPGKILHEMRFGATTGLALGGGDVYYGSIDATPLFVMLLGELRRWDPRDQLVERLLPHADRALEWILDFGDRDGDGYVEYQRHSPDGLANQGWKDSWDAVRFADGRLADTPIALCEVQAYVYAAFVARSHLAEESGDAATAARWSDAARRLRDRFNEDFWLEERGWFALGLDRDKRPIDSLCSNMGHCLWTGIVEPDRAAAVAEQLISPELFSGFGVRTMATSMAAYNPVSYHNGSVWPHDNALCAAGLARYGFDDEANRVIAAQLAVADRMGGRLPELFAGFDVTEMGVPAPYPTSCSPQAWAAASPLLWIRTMLGLVPAAPRATVWLDPVLPVEVGSLELRDIRIGDHQLSVRVHGGRIDVDASDGLTVVRGQPPATPVPRGGGSGDPDGATPARR